MEHARLCTLRHVLSSVIAAGGFVNSSNGFSRMCALWNKQWRVIMSSKSLEFCRVFRSTGGYTLLLQLYCFLHYLKNNSYGCYSGVPIIVFSGMTLLLNITQIYANFIKFIFLLN